MKKMAGVFLIAGILTACSNNGSGNTTSDSTTITPNKTDTASRMTTADSASAAGTKVTNTSDSAN